MQEEEILPFEHDGLDIHTRLDSNSLANDPLIEVLQL